MAHGLDNHTQADYARFWRESRLEGRVKKQTAFEAGCGSGAFGLQLAMRGWQVTGVDISRTLVRRANQLARSQRLHYKARVADLFREAKGRKKYDLVLCPMVLHHFPDLDGIVCALAKLLRPKGRFVLIEPNGSHLIIVFSEWVRRELWPFSRMRQLASPNETNHSVAAYRHAFAAAGLKLEHLAAFEAFPVPGDYGIALNILLFLKKALTRCMSAIFPGERGGSTLVITAKAT